MGTSLLGGTKSFTLLVCRSSSVILLSLSADAIMVPVSVSESVSMVPFCEVFVVPVPFSESVSMVPVPVSESV